ncbi:MAG: flavodoxin [Treponema sp.]|nr:flavodoxin [Treponema sp.]MCL2237701.1 flavodoxin [Treponema sp.]
MKTAVVFYSLDGNCAFIAREIKAMMDAELIRIHTKDEKVRTGISKFFWSMGMVPKKYPAVKPVAFDPAAYDLIIIGAPVWASSPASPVRTFAKEAGIKDKKIALYVCHAGGMGDALKKFKALFHGNNIASEIDFNTPGKMKNIEEIKLRISDWVEKLK